MKLEIELLAQDGRARTGVVSTARGSFQTPIFMPVGTRGAVRTLTTEDLERLNPEIVLGNTYHLMLRPGSELVNQLGGLHGFMGWKQHLLTDSGGFQIFSLAPKVDDEGAKFRSVYDGSYHHLSPEKAATVQAELGADIQMILDVCPPLPSEPHVIRQAVERSILWARRGRTTFLQEQATWQEQGRDQAQFGIVQGGIDPELRVESAKRTIEIGFDGYAVGGLSVGETRHQMVEALGATMDELPASQPRYFMGLGDPVGLVEAVNLGVDMFDCVLPTRLARHGTLLTTAGRLNLRNAQYRHDDGPLDPNFNGDQTGRYSRAYLRHLLTNDEPTAATILTRHNVAWLMNLVKQMREAIRAGRFAALRQEILEVWA